MIRAAYGLDIPFSFSNIYCFGVNTFLTPHAAPPILANTPPSQGWLQNKIFQFCFKEDIDRGRKNKIFQLRLTKIKILFRKISFYTIPTRAVQTYIPHPHPHPHPQLFFIPNRTRIRTRTPFLIQNRTRTRTTLSIPNRTPNRTLFFTSSAHPHQKLHTF